MDSSGVKSDEPRKFDLDSTDGSDFLATSSDESSTEQAQTTSSDVSSDSEEPATTDEPMLNSCYMNELIARQSVHLRKKELAVGTEVWLVMDFDSNAKTRKIKLVNFFDDQTFVISEILKNNMIKIRDEKGEEQIVFRGSHKVRINEVTRN